MRFRCASCEAEHDIHELSFAAHEPAQWLTLDDAEREGSELSGDQCVIRTKEETAYFVAASLDLPIAGTDDCYTWGVWVSLSETSFDEMNDHWADPERERLGPYFGWLCTPLPHYPDTMLLKTKVHQRAVGLRPLVEVEPTDHPLAVQQREGIARESLFELLQSLLHEHETAG